MAEGVFVQGRNTPPVTACAVPVPSERGPSADGGAEMIHYNGGNIANARRLRREMTPWERKLWYCFLKQYPIRFQRQKCIGPYIADFYCSKAGIVIELDGSGHYMPEQEAYDRYRAGEMEALGISTLRFCNTDIDANFYGVCTRIDEEVKKRI